MSKVWSRRSLKECERVIGYSFRKKGLLKLALTHPSFASENNLPSNERLEFLGDAVLSLVIATFLYRKFPLSAEGDLTVERAKLVNRRSLYQLSKGLGLGKFILLGKGEEKQEGRKNISNLANLLEAIIGAVYLDGGYDKAKLFIKRLFPLSVLLPGQ